VIAAGVRIANEVQPVHGHSFAVVLGRQQQSS
jgi:hypothetical protein